VQAGMLKVELAVGGGGRPVAAMAKILLSLVSQILVLPKPSLLQHEQASRDGRAWSCRSPPEGTVL